MIRYVLIPLVVLTMLYTTSVGAQGSCGDRAFMVLKLDAMYGEVRRGFGLSNGILIEVWASSATGTFTILRSYKTGVACVLAAGRWWVDEDWQAVELQKGPKT